MFSTIITGIIIATIAFSLKTLLEFLIFNPLSDYQELKGEITESLVFYANIHPDDDLNAVQDHFRKLASRTFGISEKWLFKFHFKSFDRLHSAASNLIGYSNALTNYKEKDDFRKKIEASLLIGSKNYRKSHHK